MANQICSVMPSYLTSGSEVVAAGERLLRLRGCVTFHNPQILRWRWGGWRSPKHCGCRGQGSRGNLREVVQAFSRCMVQTRQERRRTNLLNVDL